MTVAARACYPRFAVPTASDLGVDRRARGTHEGAVERFYARGVHGRTDIHRGYLNFGYWEDGNDDYVSAAETLVRRIGTLAGLAAGSRLLDVGCGHGTQDIQLYREFGPLEVDALDVTRQHVESGRRQARAHGVEDAVRFHHGSATDLPFEPETFTHCIGIEGPVHFLTRRRFFEDAARVLRPGGVLALADYLLTRSPATALERTIFRAGCALWHVPRENVYGPEEYRRHLEDAGFRAVAIEHVGARTFPGYYREQQRPAFRREMVRLQGVLLGRLGHIVNVAAYKAYELGLCDYVLVRAERA